MRRYDLFMCHESHGHIEVGGSMKREDTEAERVCAKRGEETGEERAAAVLKGTGFILRLRRSGTFDVTLC